MSSFSFFSFIVKRTKVAGRHQQDSVRYFFRIPLCRVQLLGAGTACYRTSSPIERWLVRARPRPTTWVARSMANNPPGPIPVGVEMPLETQDWETYRLKYE